MNGTHGAGDFAHNGSTEEEFAFSDTDADDAPDAGLGDYSARLEELMSDGEEHGGEDGDEDGEEEEEEGFIYSGVDSDPTGGYREQLRQVLGPDHEEDELEEDEVERSLVHEVAENEKFAATIEDEAGVSCATYTLYRTCLTMLFAGHSSMSRFCPRGLPRPAPPPRCTPRLHHPRCLLM